MQAQTIQLARREMSNCVLAFYSNCFHIYRYVPCDAEKQYFMYDQMNDSYKVKNVSWCFHLLWSKRQQEQDE